MSWQVSIKKHALKQLLKLPVHVAETTRFLVREMERAGPLRHNWKNGLIILFLTDVNSVWNQNIKRF